MGTELLVEDRVEDTRRLLVELARAGVAVDVTVCARTGEYDRWSVVLATGADDYHTVYNCLARVPDASIDLGGIRLVRPSDPIARDALAARARQRGWVPVRYRKARPGITDSAKARLGSLDVEEAYILPPNHGEMTRAELVYTLIALTDRPAGAAAHPSVIRLRDGGRSRASSSGSTLACPVASPSTCWTSRPTRSGRSRATTSSTSCECESATPAEVPL